MSSYKLDTPSIFEFHNLNAEVVTYQNTPALRLLQKDIESEQECIAIIRESIFKNGVIEVDVAGLPRANAPEYARGFIGVAFRVQPNGGQFEYIFIRPANGRADDQLRRNHSTQYCSHPDYPWFRLRDENPGVYESYTDLVIGEWTRIKIVATGVQAKLYVNNADQPCLIINDLKLGESQGQIALWVGSGTEAYFSNLDIASNEEKA